MRGIVQMGMGSGGKKLYLVKIAVTLVTIPPVRFGCYRSVVRLYKFLSIYSDNRSSREHAYLQFYRCGPFVVLPDERSDIASHERAVHMQLKPLIAMHAHSPQSLGIDKLCHRCIQFRHRRYMASTACSASKTRRGHRHHPHLLEVSSDSPLQ
jgi:hypothetical protein